MKHLLSILLIYSIGFTQELTIDGNLNVTGNIQNQTIDSLQQVIAGLEAQITALQSGGSWETRVFEYDFSIECSEVVALELDILNYINYGILNLISIQNLSNDNFMNGEPWINLTAINNSYIQIGHWMDNGMHLWRFRDPAYKDIIISPANESTTTDPNYNIELELSNCSSGGNNESVSGRMMFAITADFSNAPTYQAPAPQQNSRSAK